MKSENEINHTTRNKAKDSECAKLKASLKSAEKEMKTKDRLIRSLIEKEQHSKSVCKTSYKTTQQNRIRCKRKDQESILGDLLKWDICDSKDEVTGKITERSFYEDSHNWISREEKELGRNSDLTSPSTNRVRNNSHEFDMKERYHRFDKMKNS